MIYWLDHTHCLHSLQVPNCQHATVSCDLSMGVANGAEAVHFAIRQVQAIQPLRPLLLFLKALLKERQLNEVRTGGLSSYCLLNMVRLSSCVNGCCWAVVIFWPIYRLAHPENYQFS